MELWLSATGTPWFVARVFFAMIDHGKIATVLFNKIGFRAEQPFFDSENLKQKLN
jgi:hypothetical protein